MLNRRVGLARFDVVEDVMPVRERAALGVLAGEPDRDPLDEQARERERLGLPPVDSALFQRLGAPVELFLQLWMNREPFRNGDERAVELAQAVGGDGGNDLGAGGERDP